MDLLLGNPDGVIALRSHIGSLNCGMSSIQIHILHSKNSHRENESKKKYLMTLMTTTLITRNFKVIFGHFRKN
jgi:hypothetical protein